MASTDPQVGEPQPINKDYVDIIRSDVEVNKAFLDENGQPAKIVYFCRDCKKLTVPKRIGKKFQFSCSVCGGKNVAFGSEKSIASYYKDAHKREPEKTKK